MFCTSICRLTNIEVFDKILICDYWTESNSSMPPFSRFLYLPSLDNSFPSGLGNRSDRDHCGDQINGGNALESLLVFGSQQGVDAVPKLYTSLPPDANALLFTLLLKLPNLVKRKAHLQGFNEFTPQVLRKVQYNFCDLSGIV